LPGIILETFNLNLLIAAGMFEDTPRRLGKSGAGLVGAAPLGKMGNHVFQRQNSPVPLAVFARRQ